MLDPDRKKSSPLFEVVKRSLSAATMIERASENRKRARPHGEPRNQKKAPVRKEKKRA